VLGNVFECGHIVNISNNKDVPVTRLSCFENANHTSISCHYTVHEIHVNYFIDTSSFSYSCKESVVIYQCKGKADPLQAWTGPEVSRKLRFPDFMTTAQDGGKFVSLSHRPPLSPGNTPGTHFC
jgi:hypothetical protein